MLSQQLLLVHLMLQPHGLAPSSGNTQRPRKHAAGILMRGFVQPLLLPRLPLIWWSGLMFATYQICFNR